MRALIPSNEEVRLAALDSYDLRDMHPDPDLDRFTRMVATFFNAPICLLSLVDRDRQFFQSRYGVSFAETPRDQSFCAHAILSEKVTVVPDARTDARFADNPLVIRAPKIRFYMGAPLITPDRLALGTVCVIDVKEREYPSERQIELLKNAAEQVVAHLEARREKRQLIERLNAAEAYRSRQGQREYSGRTFGPHEVNFSLNPSQQQAKQALEAAHMGYWERNAETDIIAFSPVLEEMLGMNHEQYDGSEQGWLEHINPEDRPMILSKIKEGRRTGENYIMKYRPLAKDGSERWITTTGTYRKNSKGEFAGAHGVSWDSTVSEIRARRLQMSEELFRALCTLAPIGIFRSDLNCNVTYANPTLASIFQLAEDSLVGQGWLSIIHPEDKEQLQQSMKDDAAGGLPSDYDHRLLMADGTIRWMNLRAIPVRDSDGKIVGKIGTVDDITERRLAVEQLRTAKEEGEAANRAKDLFLANVSHELRTPLNGILGMSELLTEAGLNSDQREMAEIVLESAQALQLVVGDMLDLSKLEKGSFFVVREPFHLASTIQQAVSLSKAQARKAGVTLNTSCSEDLEEYYIGDASRIKQILMHYLSNAIKFAGPGEVNIHAQSISDSGVAELLISVRDSGPGISEKDQKKLFLPFSQVDPSMTRRAGGAGLGLIICKRVAEVMDGTVGLDSKLGGGATFWVRLPLTAHKRLN